MPKKDRGKSSLSGVITPPVLSPSGAPLKEKGEIKPTAQESLKPQAAKPQAVKPQAAKPQAAAPIKNREGADAVSPVLSRGQATTSSAASPAPSPAASLSERLPDPLQWSQAWMKIAERSRDLVQGFIARASSDGAPMLSPASPYAIGGAFLEMTQKLMAQPNRLWAAQVSLWENYMRLWQHTTRRMMGDPSEAEPPATTTPGDKRFLDPLWEQNAVFDFIKQSYLLSAQWLQATVDGVEGLDEHTRKKLDFYTRQFVDALSPSNFVMTNPQVLRTTLETGGENLLRGLERLLDDLERGKGQLKVLMTDPDAFAVGRNLATTPGKVVYQNDLMQLIQYAPSTEKVYAAPLLIIPPWINKFYILDLQEKNSFVRWAVAQGHTVFMVSWVNPDARLAQKSFEDYLREGFLAAISDIKRRTDSADVHVIGYCLGGTLLACGLSYLAQKPTPALPQVKAATFLVTLTDFKNPGDLGVFIDEEQIQAVEKQMEKTGVFAASAMAQTFNLLRANDLIWSFVVNNYLLGKEPLPFDLLYWNSDSTNLPAAMHSAYLRSMYQNNLLIQAGGLQLLGVPMDLRRIQTPAYLLSCREDHIAPWASTYAATQFYKGTVRFVLSASGHIAGVINPPKANKYGYWTNEALPTAPEQWLAGAERKEGSWWLDWADWIKGYAGTMVPAREVKDGIEDAPGSYVKVRAD